MQYKGSKSVEQNQSTWTNMLLIKDKSSSPNMLSWGSKSLERERFWQYNFASLTAEASISRNWKEKSNWKHIQKNTFKEAITKE